MDVSTIPQIRPETFPAPLRGIAAKVREGGRLDEADALACLTTPHLLHLGKLADTVRRRLHGNVTYFNINRHINPTNVCVYTYNCKFCSFAALPGESHAWEMSLDDVYKHAADQGGNRVTEFHIVGGLHPDIPLSWYEEMLRGLKERFPNAHLKAFTAIEIGWFAKHEKISIEEVLTRLRAAGLGSLPGGGAEIFHPEVREIICDGKLDADEWIEVHRIAHKMGIKSNCTMLYGHVERPEHRVDHLMRLRSLQDETGGFNAFIPLAYHPENNYLGLKYHTTGQDDLRHIATARLVLDNIPHIKAYWVMITPKLAQVALRFGADDLDGTVVEEKIYHMAGAGTAQQLSRPELERIVREAGFVPVERDTLYNPITPLAAIPPLTPTPLLAAS
ncbi:MAG: aminofutalosine synthase MqnE [Thermoanaerobaculia bacterium]